ncbi:MAG: alpha/beta hydrolase [Pseudomonadota bacterium]
MEALEVYRAGVLSESDVATDNYRLWAGSAPRAVAEGLLDQPLLSVHLPEVGRGNGCGVIVCPGGGYRVLASDHEGLQVAQWLNDQGIAAFVLCYRVAPTYMSDVSLLDGQRAMRWVRCYAAAFDIDPERLGMLGFSAGGHLTLAVGTNPGDGDPEHPDIVERCSARPAFLVPVYAVTNGAVRGRKADEYTPTDEWVSGTTPPAFIVTTHGDTIVPASQSTLFYNAMLAAGRQAELHIFGDGEHGLGLMPGDPDVGVWPLLLRRWLARRGMLSAKPRVPIAGRVLAAGKPMGIVWVSLLPNDADQPLARVRINRDSGGEFTIPADEGPIAGPHRLQVRWVSDHYPHTPAGVYSLAAEKVYETQVDVGEGFRLDLDLQDADWS